jgi:hypothetical protein
LIAEAASLNAVNFTLASSGTDQVCAHFRELVRGVTAEFRVGQVLCHVPPNNAQSASATLSA